MINKIINCKKRNIVDSFNNIEEVVEFIKSPNQEHFELVEYARTLDRSSDEYRDIKTNKLPAISINFTFNNGYITGKNASDPTGYLYLDIDGLTENDIEINKTYVCAYWRSLSNTGITIVIKVSGLNHHNYQEATREIAKLLDLPYDKNAVSIDRLTVLSYDPKAFYNDNTEVIPVQDLLPENPPPDLPTKSTHYNNNLRYNTKGYDCNGYELRFNNLDEVLADYPIKFDNDGVYDFGSENKIKYSYVHVPFKKVGTGNRENIMKSITYQIYALNQNAPKQLIMNYIKGVNSYFMIPPLSEKELSDTLNKLYCSSKKIEPIINGHRRFIYDDQKSLTTTEKRKFNIIRVNKERTEKTKQFLYDIMYAWNETNSGKLTINNLTKVSRMNRKTVQNYYSELKKLL